MDRRYPCAGASVLRTRTHVEPPGRTLDVYWIDGEGGRDADRVAGRPGMCGTASASSTARAWDRIRWRSLRVVPSVVEGQSGPGWPRRASGWTRISWRPPFGSRLGHER